MVSSFFALISFIKLNASAYTKKKSIKSEEKGNDESGFPVPDEQLKLGFNG